MSGVQRSALDRAFGILFAKGHIGAAYALCSPEHEFGDMVCILLSFARTAPELSEVLEEFL